MIDGFRFYSPQWFALLPLLGLAVWWAHHPRRQAAAVFSSLRDLKGLPVTLAQRIRRLLPLVYGIGLWLLVFALARPQAARSESRIFTEGIAVEMALDTSGSMQAIDFQIEGESRSRLDAVKYVTRQFVLGSDDVNLAGRPNDLLGIVAFAGYADSRCPLTLDHGALVNIAQELQTPQVLFDKRGKVLNEEYIREEMQTAIGDGLSLALDRLRNVEAKSKVVILLSDGDNNAGVVEPLEAAKAAKKMGIKVYTIGIGQTGWAPVPVDDGFGGQLRQPQFFRLDEDLLREVAQTTGGKFFNAKDTEALLSVYGEIDQLEKSKVEQVQYEEYSELYPWLAIPGVLLLVLVMFLNATRFRSLP